MAATRTVRSVEVESLTPDEKLAFDQLLVDYKAATVHVPGFTGNIAKKIAVALIQDGWRKRTV